ncbi:CRAMP1 isoform 4, partial [Pan troglodytes]
GKLFSPSKEAELTFRQHLNSISMQSDFFLPKPRKLRNRHLRKPLVVQRTLLPRPSENQSHNVCSFSILSNSSVTGAIDLAATSAGILSGNPLPALDTEGLSGISPLSSDEVTGAISGQDSTGTHQDGDTLPTVGGSSVLSLSELPKAPLQNGLSIPLSSSESSSTRLSPPDVSALLDISLPGP